MKIAIIGAGPSGLAALRYSLDEGHICEVFEKTAFIGGTWNYVDEVGKDEYGLPIHSSMYEHLRTNKPKELMLFEDFPYRADLECSYISHKEVLNYINEYAENFGLLDHIKFLHHVENIDPINKERWLIKVKNLKTNKTEVKEFDIVMVCVGHYATPVIPNIPEMKNFKGRLIHSHDYRKADFYIDRNVLIVGNGPSGADISRKLSSVAKKVVMSQRTENWFCSKSISKKLTIKPQIAKFLENGVKFEDESEEDFDDVILCTGYKISFPFLSSTCGLEVEDTFIKYLYKHTINVEHPTMAFIGMPKNVPLFPMFCIQVRFFLAYLNGNFTASREEMMEDIHKYLNECKESGKPPHMEIGRQFKTFFDDLAETANIDGIRPVISKMFSFIINDGLGKFDLAYRIMNDDEFEYYSYNNQCDL